ncbi:hypothetical protein CPB85DRAFT_1252348 [Mucidula mucida]|nr:hypothetical protein CPB85DRAFT_1252348 [Mucidula mucida]
MSSCCLSSSLLPRLQSSWTMNLMLDVFAIPGLVVGMLCHRVCFARRRALNAVPVQTMYWCRKKKIRRQESNYIPCATYEKTRYIHYYPQESNYIPSVIHRSPRGCAPKGAEEDAPEKMRPRRRVKEDARPPRGGFWFEWVCLLFEVGRGEGVVKPGSGMRDADAERRGIKGRGLPARLELREKGWSIAAWDCVVIVAIIYELALMSVMKKSGKRRLTRLGNRVRQDRSTIRSGIRG